MAGTPASGRGFRMPALPRKVAEPINKQRVTASVLKEWQRSDEEFVCRHVCGPCCSRSEADADGYIMVNLFNKKSARNSHDRKRPTTKNPHRWPHECGGTDHQCPCMELSSPSGSASPSSTASLPLLPPPAPTRSQSDSAVRGRSDPDSGPSEQPSAKRQRVAAPSAASPSHAALTTAAAVSPAAAGYHTPPLPRRQLSASAPNSSSVTTPRYPPAPEAPRFFSSAPPVKPDDVWSCSIVVSAFTSADGPRLAHLSLSQLHDCPDLRSLAAADLEPLIVHQPICAVDDEFYPQRGWQPPSSLAELESVNEATTSFLRQAANMRDPSLRLLDQLLDRRRSSSSHLNEARMLFVERPVAGGVKPSCSSLLTLQEAPPRLLLMPGLSCVGAHQHPWRLSVATICRSGTTEWTFVDVRSTGQRKHFMSFLQSLTFGTAAGVPEQQACTELLFTAGCVTPTRAQLEEFGIPYSCARLEAKRALVRDGGFVCFHASDSSVPVALEHSFHADFRWYAQLPLLVDEARTLQRSMQLLSQLPLARSAECLASTRVRASHVFEAIRRWSPHLAIPFFSRCCKEISAEFPLPQAEAADAAAEQPRAPNPRYQACAGQPCPSDTWRQGLLDLLAIFTDMTPAGAYHQAGAAFNKLHHWHRNVFHTATAVTADGRLQCFERIMKQWQEAAQAHAGSTAMAGRTPSSPSGGAVAAAAAGSYAPSGGFHDQASQPAAWQLHGNGAHHGARHGAHHGAHHGDLEWAGQSFDQHGRLLSSDGLPVATSHSSADSPTPASATGSDSSSHPSSPPSSTHPDSAAVTESLSPAPSPHLGLLYSPAAPHYESPHGVFPPTPPSHATRSPLDKRSSARNLSDEMTAQSGGQQSFIVPHQVQQHFSHC